MLPAKLLASPGLLDHERETVNRKQQHRFLESPGQHSLQLDMRLVDYLVKFLHKYLAQSLIMS